MPQVKIENRSQKILQSVQIRWTIAHKDEPDVVLLEGVMPSTDARIEPFNPPTGVNIPHLYVNKIVKPLLKEGELNGHILLTLGIQEARFVDGTEWHISGQVAFLKTTLMRRPLGLSPPDFKPANFREILFFDISSWRSKPQPISGSPCEEQPRLFASAVLFKPLQITDPPCRENRSCDYDSVNNKNICAASAGTFCDLGECDGEGHCACWQGLGPCTTCPDNDGDTHTAARCGGDDCDDDDDLIFPKARELCADGKDNDCDGDTDCMDANCQFETVCATPTPTAASTGSGSCFPPSAR